MKEKIAFVVTGYGKNINGGTEQHCRMLAERLVSDYDVEVLTTCVKDYVTGKNELSAGGEWVNGVLVRRFMAEPIHSELHSCYIKKSKWIRRLRKCLYQFSLLRFVANVHLLWHSMWEEEQKIMQSYTFYSPQLIAYIQEHKCDYKAIIPINISYPLAYYASLSAPGKTILIPTMHYESSTFRAIYAEVFTKVAYIGFNTTAEQKLAENIFGRRMSPHGIISVGVETAKLASWQVIKVKYKLPEDYLLYIGRVTSGKIGPILEYFDNYKKRYKQSSLKLVLVGGIDTNQQLSQTSDVFYTGFVSDEEKMVILQHAKIVVNPSKFESLSLMLLEAMNQGKAALVNGHCTVLKEHCIKSDYAALYYTRKANFISKLYLLDSSFELREQMGKKAKEYVKKHFDWSLILKRLKEQIEIIGIRS